MKALALALTLFSCTAAATPLVMPGVDLAGLAAADAQALSTLMQEGACPCQPSKSLLECIQAKSCPAATELAAYGAKKFRDGLGLDQVRDAVVKKYLDDNVTYTFDLKDTPAKGAAKGRVVIVEFADFECPHCGLLSKELPAVLAAWPDDVTLYFKHFPLGTHLNSDLAARATWAAGRQGRFWPMHDLVFAHQATLTAEKIHLLAQEIGLNLEKFKVDVESEAARQAINRDRAEGAEAGLSGTPTLYINGKLYHEEKNAEAINAYVKELLQKIKK